MGEGEDRDELTIVEALASVWNLAKLARSYYVQLIEEGFTAGEAMALTISWQAAMIRPQQSAGE